MNIANLHENCALQKDSFSASGTHFCEKLSEPQGLVRPGELGKLKKLIHIIGSRTRDLPARSTAP
jgi:hypothetical protein